MNAAEFLLGADALAKHGRRIALRCGDESVSYAELAALVRRASGVWRSLGAVRGERVLLALRDTPDFAAAWLGALHAGIVVVAVNVRLSAAEHRYILEDSGARLFLVEDAFAPAARSIAGAGCVPLSGWQVRMDRDDAQSAPADMRADEPGFWLYSSGTTGNPKGIVHAHKDVLPSGQAMREILGLQAGDVVFGTSKLFFAYGLEHGLLGALSTGATSVLHAEAMDPEQAIKIVARHRPAVFFSVPSLYRRLLGSGADALNPFRAVRHCVAAGERLPAGVLDRWRAATGGEILSLYGMSETYCVAMMTPPGAAAPARTGRPLAGVETRLLNDRGVEASEGEPGVLWLRHPALAAEYANQLQATREQFVDGWFCTRDVFSRDADGYFCHQGRSDEFIKVAGQWVQPGELEEAVIDDPAVAEAACVPVHDADGFERLALFVSARADPQAAMAAAARACEQNLPNHKRPKWIRAVSELPRTATGKVQRFKLRELIRRELAGND